MLINRSIGILLTVTLTIAQNLGNTPPSLRIQEVRLQGGNGPHEGNVQVTVGGAPVYVCDDGFGFAEADAVCRDLGYEGAERYARNNYFGMNTPELRRSTQSFFTDRLNCTLLTNNAGYSSCPIGEPSRHDCLATEIAGVECRRSSESQCPADQYPCQDSVTCISRDEVCNGIPQCPDGSDETEDLCNDVGVVRLVTNVTVNIPGAILGSVQIKYNEEWGVMCDDRADRNAAQVLCRSMGYEGGWVVPFAGSYLGEASGSMIVDTPQCKGDEQWIGQCPAIEWGVTDCPEEREDFGVFCYSEGVEVRLAGNTSPNSGRVELKMGDEWGSVCSTGFDIFDAQVFCRMLGYNGDAVAHRDSGRSAGPIWDLQMDCLGLETNIQECRVRIINGTCPSTQTAGITCSHESGRVENELKTLLGDTACGIPEDSSGQFLTRLAKIRGGFSPPRFENPWMVSLRTRKERGGNLLCGGAIISEDYVLTAAHCVDTVGALNVVVRVGDYNSDFNENLEQDFFIDKIYSHEYEDEAAFNDNDIALIKIERKGGRGMRFNSRVRPICLPTVNDNYEDLSDCKIAGWGPGFFLDDPVSRLRTVETDIVSDIICEGSGGGPANYTSSMVCVGRPRTNACKGDSGGPLTCPVQGRQTLYGLVSSGRPCTFTSSVDTFTRITKFLDWILGKVKLSQGIRG